MIEKKENIPEEFACNLDLPDDSFADTTNKIFPLDNRKNIEDSMALAFNNELDFYSPEEKLKVIEEIALAAKSYDIEIIHKGGNNSMDMLDTPEVQKVIADEVEKRVAEMKTDETLENVKAEAEAMKQKLAEAEKKTKEMEEDKKKTEEEMKKKEEEDKKKEKAKARIDEMKEKGFTFEKNSDFVFSLAKEMNDEEFSSFVGFVDEAFNLGKASVEREDPVNESRADIVNKVNNGSDNDPFPTITKFLEAIN